MLYILKNYIQDAVHSIWSNKLRSFLSILGIVIGIVSVVVFLGIGKGAEMEMKQFLDQHSSKSLNVRPKLGMYGDPKPNAMITDDIVSYLKKYLHGVKAIFPSMSTSKQISFGGDASDFAQVVGADEKYFEIFDKTKIAYGRPFSSSEFEKKIKVGVLNYKLAKDLFKGKSALGKYLKVGDDVFMVVGVLEPTQMEKEYIQYTSGKIFVPTSVYQELFLGKISYEQLTVYAQEETNMKVLEYEMNYLLMRKTGKQQKSELDFQVMDDSKFQKEQEEFATKAKLILMGIGAISLLVGGIGVMNIMLVSVTERTREIGIRKAIGARKFHIIGQFITESILISIIGGIFAVGLSYGIVHLLKKNNVPALLTLDVLMLACLFSVGVGVIFGLLPALRAAKLKPIDALRFE